MHPLTATQGRTIKSTESISQEHHWDTQNTRFSRPSRREAQRDLPSDLTVVRPIRARARLHRTTGENGCPLGIPPSRYSREFVTAVKSRTRVSIRLLRSVASRPERAYA